MKTIRIHGEARAEVDETMNWYETQRLGLGLDFHAEFERLLTSIQAAP